jgi:protein-tyrosine-phosphatase
LAGSRQLSGRDIDVLFVCTANQCRSPLAAVLLHARVPTITIASVGTGNYPGPATAPTRAAAAALGLDLAAHRSHQLDADVIDRSRLLVAMERAHVREIVVRDPSAFARTFTLRELVRRGEQVGPRRPIDPLEAWLDTVGAGRTTSDFLGSDDDDDVADPVGRSQKVHDATAAELASLVDRLATVAFP